MPEEQALQGLWGLKSSHVSHATRDLRWPNDMGVSSWTYRVSAGAVQSHRRKSIAGDLRWPGDDAEEGDDEDGAAQASGPTYSEEGST